MIVWEKMLFIENMTNIVVVEEKVKNKLNAKYMFLFKKILNQLEFNT